MGTVQIAGVQFELSFAFPGEYRFTAVALRLCFNFHEPLASTKVLGKDLLRRLT